MTTPTHKLVPVEPTPADHFRDATEKVLPAVAEDARGARFLFIAMDDDKVAHLTYCADEAEVEAAVCAAMFWLKPGEHLDADHLSQLKGVTEELLDGGVMTFEGDAPLYLFKLPQKAPVLSNGLTEAETLQSASVAGLTGKLPPRWYVVDKEGIATLCKDYDDAQDVAAECFVAWPQRGPHHVVQLVAAQPPAQQSPTAPNLACKSVQARLATQWGYVRASEVAQQSEPVAYLYHDANTPQDAHPWLHSTLLALSADRRPGLRNETPLYAHQPAQRQPRSGIIQRLQDEADEWRAGDPSLADLLDEAAADLFTTEEVSHYCRRARAEERAEAAQRQPLTDEQAAALTIMLDHFAGDPRAQCLRPLVDRTHAVGPNARLTAPDAAQRNDDE